MDPHHRMRIGPSALGEPGVIAVRMRQQNGLQVVERPAERSHGADEPVPVTRRSRVDERELAAVLHQVEVDDAVRQPVDAVGDLHRDQLAAGGGGGGGGGGEPPFERIASVASLTVAVMASPIELTASARSFLA